MKNIKELGLELIELEDRFLLVTQNEMISPDDLIFESKDRLCSVTESTYTNPEEYGVYKILASTVKLKKGLPLLVIEDEGMLNALNLIHQAKIDNKSTQLILIGAYTSGFDKAKETYKFTEGDLRNAIQYGRSIGYDYASQETYLDSQDLRELEEGQDEDVENYIQSLTKKELWVEVEEYDHAQNITDRHKFKPNVSQGKIKAVWK